MPNLNNVKCYVALETTAGITVPLTSAVPIRDLPSLDKNVERKASEVILGNSMRSGEYTLASDVKGSLSINPRVGTGTGKLLKAHLGLETTTAQQIGGILRIRYVGTQASCKLVVNATTITSNIGALGAEVADAGVGVAGFGTSGVITLASYATLTALQAFIATLTNYKCDLVMGAAAASTTTPGPIAITKVQAANKFAYVYFQSATSGAYIHTIQPDLSINERPSLSIQKEGYQDNFCYGGCYINNLNLSGALKGYITVGLDVVGMNEAIGQTAVSGVSIPMMSDLVFQNGSFFFDKTVYTYVRNFNLKSTNNFITDGYGLSSIDRQYVQKGLFDVSGDFEIKLDSNSYTERANLFNSTSFAMSLQFNGNALPNFMNEIMIIECPSVSVDTYAFSNSSGVLFAKIGYKVFNTPTQYDSPVSITLISTDNAVYNS
jgi:hypothetical protein